MFQTYWPDCPYHFVLVTETKKFACDFANVTTLPCGKISWGGRVKKALSEIRSEYILYFLEDFFLMRPIDIDAFNLAAEKITKDKNIGYIGLKYNSSYKVKPEFKANNDQPFWNKDDLELMHRVNNMAALWRRDWFIKLIRTYETPWEFDNYATIRSRRYKYDVLLINNLVCAPVFDYGVDYEYGYGISRGKWLPKNKELFELNGIEVDFEKLGWLDMDSINASKTETTKKPMIKSIREKLYFVKKKLRKFRSIYLPY